MKLELLRSRRSKERLDDRSEDGGGGGGGGEGEKEWKINK
jgi:hypothetical protein